MNDVYFVRHAHPDFSVREESLRPLSAKGLADRRRVNRFFRDIPVGAVVSSPFKRAADTVRPLAEEKGLELILREEFAERKIADRWIEDYETFSRRQWLDIDYALPGGESLRQVQQRYLDGLTPLLKRQPAQPVVVGCHGCGLSALLHHFDPAFGYESFRAVMAQMPFLVHMEFDGRSFLHYNIINLFAYPEDISNDI